MSEFESILEKSLKGVSSGFQRAVEDLNEVVESLDQAVQKALQPKRSRLRLEPIHESAVATVFRLDLTVWEIPNRPPPPRGISVGEYHLGPNGYPIKAGSWDSRQDSFSVAVTIINKSGLEKHFKEMLANASSPLVTEVAFHVRRQKTPA